MLHFQVTPLRVIIFIYSTAQSSGSNIQANGGGDMLCSLKLVFTLSKPELRLIPVAFQSHG